MTLLSAAKLLLALGCLDGPKFDPNLAAYYDPESAPPKEVEKKLGWKCVVIGPNLIQCKKAALVKREKECPKAVAEFKKAVGGGK